jgi:hypothetical protein
MTAAVSISGLAPQLFRRNQTSFSQAEALTQSLLNGKEIRDDVRILLLVADDLGFQKSDFLVEILDD